MRRHARQGPLELPHRRRRGRHALVVEPRRSLALAFPYRLGARGLCGRGRRRVPAAALQRIHAHDRRASQLHRHLRGCAGGARNSALGAHAADTVPRFRCQRAHEGAQQHSGHRRTQGERLYRRSRRHRRPVARAQSPPPADDFRSFGRAPCSRGVGGAVPQVSAAHANRK
eukprot:Amastigsp_a677199_83.p4 type:complete len:171 gc:universal Amastigsp_a677199_83:1015-1527(+)